jgi:hypothetical protein
MLSPYDGKPGARVQPLLEAEAQRKLLAVICKPLLGSESYRSVWIGIPH